jgi:hypothetical protein
MSGNESKDEKKLPIAFPKKMKKKGRKQKPNVRVRLAKTPRGHSSFAWHASPFNFKAMMTTPELSTDPRLFHLTKCLLPPTPRGFPSGH